MAFCPIGHLSTPGIILAITGGFLVFFFFLMYICVCECMSHACGCLQRQEEVAGTPGARVTNSLELPAMGAGNLEE